MLKHNNLQEASPQKNGHRFMSSLQEIRRMMRKFNNQSEFNLYEQQEDKSLFEDMRIEPLINWYPWNYSLQKDMWSSDLEIALSLHIKHNLLPFLLGFSYYGQSLYLKNISLLAEKKPLINDLTILLVKCAMRIAFKTSKIKLLIDLNIFWVLFILIFHIFPIN